jgi:hypothetical protein
MKHVTLRIGLIVALCLLILSLFWLAQPTLAVLQPPIPHPLEGRDNCLSCHEEGVGGAPKVPDNHTGRNNQSCTACHQLAENVVAPPQIPHTLEDRENCLVCHVEAGEGASPQEETSTPPPPAPIEYPESEGDANSCLECHQRLGGRSELAVTGWQESIHAERGVICAACHGGDPNSDDPEMAMSPEAGFIGKPDRTDIPALCGSCHANVDMMRQYDLPTDQLAKYQESFHGQRLAEGDRKVATCFDCHDGHATRETNDPRASVYRLNVPALCGSCHADEAYMAEYNIPTDQYQLYQESVHGHALLDEQDTRAPNCADCHGTHGAAPPGFAEVSNVCGSCHSATQDYYLEGAHNSEADDTPRCVTCHGRYDVQEPGEHMFTGDEQRQCGSCHDPDSEAGRTVLRLYEALTGADDSLAAAENQVAQAGSLGMIIAEEENLIAEARTRLITARAAQHTVSVETVQAETEAAVALSRQASEQAEAAITENRNRRLGMIVALVIDALVIVSLVFIRRELTYKE